MEQLEQDCEVYEVEKIVDYKEIHNKPYYLLKWKGYSQIYNTWEPESNILPNCTDILNDYKKQQQKSSNQVQLNENKYRNINSNITSNINKLKEKKKNNIQPHLLDDDYKDPYYQNMQAVKRKGNLSLGDKPYKIVKAIQSKVEGEVLLEIEWEENYKQKIKPENSFVSNKVVRQYNLDLLLDFYESKIII